MTTTVRKLESILQAAQWRPQYITQTHATGSAGDQGNATSQRLRLWHALQLRFFEVPADLITIDFLGERATVSSGGDGDHGVRMHVIEVSILAARGFRLNVQWAYTGTSVIAFQALKILHRVNDRESHEAIIYNQIQA